MTTKRVLTLAVIGLLLVNQPAHALVTSITKANPIAQGGFTDGAGDQVSALLSTTKAIFAVGTVEGASTELLNQNPLGGSDGFISAFSLTGALSWSLRLGSDRDDIATAALISKAGDIWVAGVSAPNSELNELTIWQISTSGTLVNTFHTSAPSIIYPHAISESSSGYLIAGNDFSVSISKSGKFSAFKSAVFKSPKAPTKFVGSKYSWNTYTGRGPVAGVPTFKPKSAQVLYYKYLNTTKKVQAAFQIPTPALLTKYQRDFGVILLSETENGFALYLLK